MDKRTYLKNILEYIPSGAQTLSKNPTQYVVGVSPLTIVKGKGPYVWDFEGNKYLDMLIALGPMILGYAEERIDNAVKNQIDQGTIFSLPSTHELTLAKLLREVVPCAQMSRFVLNGNDAMSGAVRLARFFTKRDHVAKWGYHGCQDWSICTKNGRNAGVPEIIKTLTHDFEYNNIDSLEKIFKEYPNQIAAVTMEPVSAEKPKDNFLEKVKELAHRHGAILIFDEMVTGFRWALGGAQEYFGVVPDIACFSKAISNGYPISVICGKKEIMEHMDEVFVSMTFAGSVLGLVAAIETIKIMKELGDVQQHLHQIGDELISGGNRIVQKNNLPIEFIGYGPHPVMQIKIKDDYLNRLFKSFIYQEMNKAGILYSTSIMLSYEHKMEHIKEVLMQLDKIGLKLGTINGDWKQIELWMEGEVAKPRTVRLIQ